MLSGFIRVYFSQGDGSVEAWCLNTLIRKREHGTASACHLQPYTLSDPGALEGTSGPGLGLRRCVSSIRLSNSPLKGMSVDPAEMCYVPLLFGIAGLTRSVVGGM